MERNTLMAKCYPKIKDYCREKHGLEFQVSLSTNDLEMVPGIGWYTLLNTTDRYFDTPKCSITFLTGRRYEMGRPRRSHRRSHDHRAVHERNSKLSKIIDGPKFCRKSSREIVLEHSRRLAKHSGTLQRILKRLDILCRFRFTKSARKFEF